MKVYLTDLKKNRDIWDKLPADFKRLNESDYYLFYYFFDDKNSRILNISTATKPPAIITTITQAIYRNLPGNEKTGQTFTPGYFQQPFDTQNALFYHWLKYVVNDDTIISAYFRDCRAQDIATVAETNKRTIFGNSYPVFSRSNVETALTKYLDEETEKINGCLAVTDILDAYLRKREDKSLYGPVLSKIVGAIKNPNGGLIPEGNGQMQYMYVGEGSAIAGADAKLTQAKDMLRAGMRIAQIYLETGWFFNKYDTKWRKRLADKDVTIADVKPGHAFIRPGSKFTEEVIYDTLERSQSSEMAASELDKYVAQGWDVTLGDILHHPLLYKHYPALYKIPVFFGVAENPINYTFYYNPHNPMLVIYGSPDVFDLKTTILHETQHAIQRIEGFAAGGSPDFAKLIMAIGGKNVKEYLFLSKQIEDEYLKGVSDKYSFHNLQALVKQLDANWRARFKTFFFSEKLYLDNVTEVVNLLINLGLQNAKFLPNPIADYLGETIFALIIKLQEYIKLGEQVSFKLRSEGFNDKDVSRIFFNAYEALGGEIEARDTQHGSALDDDMLDYLLPLSSETLDESKINTIIDETGDRPVLYPPKIKGACETTSDGKYIIHLTVSDSPEPFLHELGHIIRNVCFKNWKDSAELFTELFLCYLVRKDIVPVLTPLLKNNRTKMESWILDNELDRIFADKGFEAVGLEFIPYRNYLNKLTELVNG